MPIVIAIVVIIVGILLWVVSIYNTFVTARERVENAKSQIATQIESRWDAVKSLISATKQYSKHEADVLENVTEKRASITKNSSVDDIENSGEEFDNVLVRLIAVSENYPELKASGVYENTMNSINKYEENVRSARMIYNDTVTKMNRKINMFPDNIVANMFNFEEREYFQGTDNKQDMPSWE